ncbi:MAG TPA: 30S ribosomal protein S2 [Candidatus Omnitrophota bacterium]|nr:30S ribosomal protein S2 [Candidatus Omnitrophota bacterium]HRY85682.1 30S ribosomal protein S2 [Candidatus Omnitrophota bacterium]
MSQITIKQLLEAGVHFGHQTQRWNPKMKKYIFGERNGIYIINLELTLTCLEKALEFLKQTALEGKDVLFVGTKKQAQVPLKEAAESCGMPFVNQRWLGGMLTNFETIRKSIKKLESIDKMEQDGSFQFITKKEAGSLKKEREKLIKNLLGVREMRRLPGAVFVIDAELEKIAVAEAKKLGIPVVAVLDTNGDPDRIDYPLPGNDDAIKAIKLFCEAVSGAVAEGRRGFQKIAKDKEEALQAEAAAEESSAEGEEVVLDEEAIEEKLDPKVLAEVVVVDETKPKAKKPARKKDGDA